MHLHTSIHCHHVLAICSSFFLSRLVGEITAINVGQIPPWVCQSLRPREREGVPKANVVCNLGDSDSAAFSFRHPDSESQTASA